ncbi:diguanylate cyclase [bacterium AH-315-K03]|nr:diguanylate cyclase [bacterium AH-315-K03]
MILIRELMTPVSSAAAPNDTLSKAISLMQASRHSCVLVIDDGIPVGIITERDVVGLFSNAINQNMFEDLTLAKVMTTELICVKEDTSLYDGLNLAWEKKLRHLPVVNDLGYLVGLVTQTDMLSCYAQFFERQTELETANQKLQMLSYEDALLGIGNRRAMEAGLVFTEASAKRNNNSYTIALMDVDFFKKYNDHYGHQAGDEALQRITKAIKSNLRDSDQLYRYGGEEFLLLMPDSVNGEGFSGAERIRFAVSNLQDPHVKSPLGHLTVSIGVASQKAGGWEDLLKSADKALYGAKGAGRNRVCGM